MTEKTTEKTIPLPENIAGAFLLLGEKKKRIDAEQRAVNAERREYQSDLQFTSNALRENLNVADDAKLMVNTDELTVTIVETVKAEE